MGFMGLVFTMMGYIVAFGVACLLLLALAWLLMVLVGLACAVRTALAYAWHYVFPPEDPLSQAERYARAAKERLARSEEILAKLEGDTYGGGSVS